MQYIEHESFASISDVVRVIALVHFLKFYMVKYWQVAAGH